MSPPLLAGLQLFLCGFVGPFDAYDVKNQVYEKEPVTGSFFDAWR